jgi:hypothetical protein
LLPLLLTKPPQIDTITFEKAPVGTVATKVTQTTFKADDNFGLLFLMMAMGGNGFGGGGGDSMNMAMLALAASGGFGKSG